MSSPFGSAEDEKPIRSAPSYAHDFPKRPKYKNPKRLKEATQSLYINVDNVDKQFERARKAGATILEEPVDTFYGHRRFGAEDPEGHQWYFAQEIKKEIVKKSAGGKSRT